MADQEREVSIKITGKNLSGPEFDQVQRQLAGVRSASDSTSASAARLVSSYRSMQQQATLTANSSGALYVDLKKVNDLAQQFGGGKAIQSAEQYAAAVQKIGGASKLTAAEQAQVNQVIELALEKYKALGQQAPAHLLALAEATKKVEAETAKVAAPSGGLAKMGGWMMSLGVAAGTFIGNMAWDAVKKLGGAIIDLAARGLTLAPTVTAFQRLAASIGESADEMLAASRTATKGLIRDLDMMAAANKGILLGLPLTSESMATMAQTALVLGKAMGQGPTKSLDDLITALGRSSPMILDNLGLSVKVGEANEVYARSLGKTADQLTDAEKKTAFYNAAMEAAKQKVASLGGVQLTTADHVERMKVKFGNMTDALGVAIATSPALNAVFESLAEAIDGAVGSDQVNLTKTLTLYINELALSVVTWVGDLATSLVWIERITAASQALTNPYAAIKGLGSSVGGQATDLQAFTAALEPRLAALKARLVELRAETGSTAEVTEKLAGAAGAGGAAAENYAANLALARIQASNLTAAQRAQIDAGLALGKSVTDISAAIGVSADALKIYQERTRAGATSTKALSKETEDYDEAVANINASLRDLSVLQLTQVRALLDMGVAERDVATALKISERHVRLVIDADKARTAAAKTESELRTGFLEAAGKVSDRLMKEEIDQLNARNKQTVVNLLATSKLEDEHQQNQARRGLSSYNQQIYAVQLWAREQKAAFRGTEAETEAETVRFYNAVDALAKDKIGSISKTWKQFFGQDFAKVVLGAFTGGGNVADAIGSSLGTQLGENLSRRLGDSLNGAGELVKGPLTKLLGSTIGGAVTTMLPGLGALLGPLAGKLTSKIVGLFTGGEGAKANDLRDQLKAKFGDAAGAGLQAAVDRFGAVQGIQDAYLRFMSAGSEADVQAAFDDMQGAIDSTNELLERYGLSLDDLRSPQERFNASIATLGDEYRTLNGMGFGDASITKGMTAGLNDMVRAALDAGGKIPAAFMPLLEQLVATGGLADDVKKRLLGAAEAPQTPWKEMEAIAKEFGIDIERLGINFQQARLIEGGQTLAEKWQLLVENGADVGAVIDGMKGSAQAFLTNALKWGLEVPASMRPMLEAMARAGVLTDENGDKLEDLGEVKFGKTIADEFTPLTEALWALVDIFTEDLPNSLDTLRRNAERGFTVPVETVARPRNGNESPGYDDDGDGVPNQDDTYPDDPNAYASGGLASGRQLARVAEGGKKEIIGDVDFMSRALTAAWGNVAARTGAGAPGNGGGSRPIQIVIPVQVGARQFDGYVIETTADAMARGEIPVPARMVRGQVSRG